MSFRILFNENKKNEYLFEVFNKNKNLVYQKDISKKIGINEKNFSKIINGNKNVSVKTARKMLDLIDDNEIKNFFIIEE